MKKLLFFVLCCCFSINLYAEKLHVFVAASARNALTDVKDAFLKTRSNTNDQVELSFGASGKAYQQFSQGLEYDLFFSADRKYAAQIVKDGNALENERVYALGAVAFYGLDAKVIEAGLKNLKPDSIQHFSIANPKVAPYGVAAEEVLKNMNLYDMFKDKIVQGDNVSQAVSFVDSGAAEVGLVAYSLVVNNAKGKAMLVDSSLYTKMEQAFVITKYAQNKKIAQDFANFIHSDTAKDIFKKHGFGTP